MTDELHRAYTHVQEVFENVYHNYQTPSFIFIRCCSLYSQRPHPYYNFSYGTMRISIHFKFLHYYITACSSSTFLIFLSVLFFF
ncbi:unnamed protein product [Rotaria socialis]